MVGSTLFFPFKSCVQPRACSILQPWLGISYLDNPPSCIQLRCMISSKIHLWISENWSQKPAQNQAKQQHTVSHSAHVCKELYLIQGCLNLIWGSNSNLQSWFRYCKVYYIYIYIYIYIFIYIYIYLYIQVFLRTKCQRDTFVS